MLPKNKRAAWIAVIAAAILVLLLLIIFSNRSSMSMNKVLIIGIDAMDPEMAERLMSEGKLPNFARLKEIGSFERLATTTPPESPVAWSAAATGSNPGKFGIYDFIGRDPKTYIPRLNLANQKGGIFSSSYESALRGKPFWKITSGAGVPTTVIRWPATFPASSVKGRMLSGLGAVDIKGYLNSYRFYSSIDAADEKTVSVKESDVITTKVYGPKIRNGKEILEIEKEMTIKLSNSSAILVIDGEEHVVNEGTWSDWIRVKFRLDFFRSVQGIFKVRLISISPFRMYMSSIQIDPEDQIIDMTYPRSYGSELAKEIGLFSTLGMPEETKALEDGRINESVFLEQVSQIEEERTKMFWHEFNRFDSGVLAFGFDASDRLQHIFWNESSISKEIEDYYAEKDRLLGQILQRMDGNTTLIIFSDHGFANFDRAVSINTWLVGNGYMVLKGNMSAGNNGELFNLVDWNRTRAYSLGFASIYINQKGREGNGIVIDKENLIDEIIVKLSNLTDNKTGKRAITKLYKGSEIYSGEFASESPDIVIGFEKGYRMDSDNAIGGLTSEIISDNNDKWKGDHLMDPSHVPGVIFTNFKIKKANPSLMDIAPTVLHILGIEVPRDMDGESLI